MTRVPRYDFSDPDYIEDAKAPPLLYHYTDTAGFFGIVESGVRLRATHYRFLNDIGELTFGRDIAREVLEQLDDLIGVDIRGAVETQLESMLQEGSYVACLSERDSVLSQWRAYAGNCCGYCLGLQSPSRTIGGSHYEEHYFNHLVKCLYGATDARNYVDSRFRRKISLAAPAKGTDGYGDRLSSQLANVAWRAIHVAKHEHFQEEAEWRFIVGGSPVSPQYRVSARGPISRDRCARAQRSLGRAGGGTEP